MKNMNARKMVGNVLIILAVAFTAYLSVVMLRRIHTVVKKSTYIKIFRYELAACAFFLLLALDIRFGFFTRLEPKVLKAAGWALRVAVVLVTAVLLFLMGKVTAGCFLNTAAPAKNALVLGLALENGKPTDDLIARLDTAEQYLQRSPDATLILTGGNPDEAGRTEAAVMRDLLSQRGVAEEKKVLEDQAETTKENFRNTARMVDPGQPVVLITSNYHMDRAAQMAKSAGFTQVLRLPAPSSPLAFGANVMWEVILELNEWTVKQ